MDFNVTDYFLTGMVNYGASILALVLLIGGIGIPLPGTFMVIVAGAFIRQGIIDFAPTLTFGLIAVVIGDSISYAMGHYAKGWVERKFGNNPSYLSAQKTFKKRGGIAIYLTRFLITPLAVPTNLIAGSTGYSYRRFLAYDLAGEATWLILFGGLGYAFGSQWEMISQLISDSSGLILGIVALIAAGYLWRKRRHHHEVKS
jgi:membrane protein DedA with SNARE-associated domain